MAKSEKLKQKHMQQIAAATAEFETYKDFIVKEFVEKFGGSYQNANSMKDVWRTAFVYTPECEKFLIKKTLFYIYMLGTSKNSNSPCFLRVLTSKISEYLSYYICKKGVSNHICAQQLRVVFFVDNQHVKQEIKMYQEAENKKQKKNVFFKKTSEKKVSEPESNKEEQIRKEFRKRNKKFVAFKISIDEYIR